jgi:NAD(P)-dependent dehydrogenase (short-subunit alcohol dehydrogenase family)
MTDHEAPLAGKVAYVTGAARGQGRSHCIRLARAGADIVAIDACAPVTEQNGYPPATPEDLAETVSLVEGEGRKILADEVDVRDAAAQQRMVADALEQFGRLDIVVANAGIARAIAFGDTDDQRWEETVDTNLGGARRCFRAALPTMVEAGWGRLLATSSIAGGLQGWSEHAAYTASKAGIVGLVRGLALEVARHGVTVNAVAPGVIRTAQSLDPVNSLGPDGVESFGRALPVGRAGVPEDIAATFAYLASEEAAFLTGQMLVVDGGGGLGGL